MNENGAKMCKEYKQRCKVRCPDEMKYNNNKIWEKYKRNWLVIGYYSKLLVKTVEFNNKV